MDTDELLAYIEQNLKEDISLVDLAQVVHYSPRQIYYRIKEATGMPVMSYIRCRRLINAAVEIAQGRKLIEVAVDYGFETQAGFYKAFLLQIGCSPKEYQYHEQLHLVHKNYPSIEKLAKEEAIMDEIRSDIVVNPAFQKQGLATRLFEEACKYASELDFSYVTTTCRSDGTERFYMSLGMRECGRIPDGIYEPWGESKRYDEILFMRELQ